MLTLPEELLLLAYSSAARHNPIAFLVNVRLDRVLIAATLIDLVLQGRIVHSEPEPCDNEVLWNHQPTYSIPGDTTTTGSSYLDHVLLTIALHPVLGQRRHTFFTLAQVYLNRVNPLSPAIYNAPPNQRLLAAKDLLAREELVKNEARFLGLMPKSQLSPGSRGKNEPLIRQKLQAAVRKNAPPPDERLRALLLLVKYAGLIAAVFGVDQHDSADWRILEILRLTREPHSPLADAHRYIVSGIMAEFDLTPLQ